MEYERTFGTSILATFITISFPLICELESKYGLLRESGFYCGDKTMFENLPKKSTFCLFFATMVVSLSGAARAGDPIPGIDVAVEQIPGGKIASKSHCRQMGGKVFSKKSKIFCSIPKRSRKKQKRPKKATN